MEGASTWDAPRRRGAAVQLFSPPAFSAEARSYPRRFIPDIRGLLFWPTSLNYSLSPPLREEDPHEEASEGRYYSTTLFEVALSHIGVYGLSC